MNILYAADDNFAPILSVSLVSLCRNASDLNVIVLDNEISEQNKKKIIDVIEPYKCQVEFRKSEIANIIERAQTNVDRGSVAQFLRLFITDILPKEWERVLYLDCDTFVNASIDTLYNRNMNGNIICAVEDSFSALNRKILGVEKNSPFVNSGVMLIDLEKWKKEQVEEKIIRVMNTNRKIPQGDQGIINKVLCGKIEILPVKYNVVSYNYDFSYQEMKKIRKPTTYYNFENVKKAKDNPVIVHFTTSFASMRPWEREDCAHPYAKAWQKIFGENGYEIIEKKEKKSYLIWNKYKGNLLIRTVGVLHSYVKPLIDIM